MTELETELRLVLGQLAAAGRSVALVGGLAVSVRAEPRLTRDADVAVSVVDDSDAEDVLAALRVSGYVVLAVVEHAPSGRLGTARLSRFGQDSGIVIDLLFAATGIEPEIVTAAETLEILPDLDVPVARTGHLIAMKLLARDDRHRPADADDLRNLALVADDAEWDRARHGVVLIERRGFNRGRDLIDDLTALEAQRAP